MFIVCVLFFPQTADTEKPAFTFTGRQKLEEWINKSMRIQMTDGRTLVGMLNNVVK